MDIILKGDHPSNFFLFSGFRREDFQMNCFLQNQPNVHMLSPPKRNEKKKENQNRKNTKRFDKMVRCVVLINMKLLIKIN